MAGASLQNYSKKKAECLLPKKCTITSCRNGPRIGKCKRIFHHAKSVLLLVDHIGNDLSRIDNEVDKMLVNLGDRKNITEDDIEKYVGVSKEYNAFELQDAMAAKDLAKAIRIIQYFEANPKAAPIQLVLPTLYNLFSKTYMIFGQNSKDEKTIAANIGVNAWFVKDYMLAARNYGL